MCPISDIYSELEELFGTNNPYIDLPGWGSLAIDGDAKSKLRQGRVETIDDVGYINLAKYLDPNYPDFKIKNKANESTSGWSDAILNPNSGSFYESQNIFRTFGDTERINLRGNRKLSVASTKLGYDPPLRGNVTFKTFRTEQYDATNPEIFTNSILYKNKPLGRTALMYIYGSWSDTNNMWSDDDNSF